MAKFTVRCTRVVQHEEYCDFEVEASDIDAATDAAYDFPDGPWITIGKDTVNFDFTPVPTT